jgi:CRP-like cAMP-binding protein
MGKEFVKEALDISTKLFRTEGEYLFHQGDRADYFYMLLKGKVKLSSRDTRPALDIAMHPGDIIGWSSLAVRGFYSTSALCMEPTNLLRFNHERFIMILEKNANIQAILSRRLSEIGVRNHFKTFPHLK